MMALIALRSVRFTEHGKDSLADPLSVLQYFRVLKAKNAEPLCFQIRRSFGSIAYVLASIDLDNQSAFEADEVDDVSVDWLLSTELRMRKVAGPQYAPKRPLGICHVSAKRTRAGNVHAPHSAASLGERGIPSPLVGEGGERSEPGEGEARPRVKRVFLPPPGGNPSPGASRHPLPQGERVIRYADHA
jgi:hypothetical protein